MLENGIKDGGGGVGDGVQARNVGAGQRQDQIALRHLLRRLDVRGHDVVDQVAIFRPGGRMACLGDLDHLAAQLHDPAPGFPVSRALQQNPGALTRDQHVEDVDDRSADVLDIFQRRGAGEDGSELIDDHVLHGFDDVHVLADAPVAGERAVGDRDELVVAALDRFPGIPFAHDGAQFLVTVAVFAGEHAFCAELAHEALPEFFRAQAILASARAHEVGGFDAGDQDVLLAENAEATDGTVRAVAVNEKVRGTLDHAEQAAQQRQSGYARRLFEHNGLVSGAHKSSYQSMSCLSIVAHALTTDGQV